MAIKTFFRKIQIELAWRKPFLEYSKKELENMPLATQKFYWQRHAKYWKESSRRHAKAFVISWTGFALYIIYNIVIGLIWP